MSKPFSELSLSILTGIRDGSTPTLEAIYETHSPQHSRKTLYNTWYRLMSDGLLEHGPEKQLQLSEAGSKLLHTEFPERDGVWKIIIFDIPEKKREVRNFLRTALQNVGFKKWQNSTWISPYKLHESFEAELNQLAEKYFIRLIKTTDINQTEDLEALFTE